MTWSSGQCCVGCCWWRSGVFLVRSQVEEPAESARSAATAGQGHSCRRPTGITYVHAFGAHSQYRIHASKEVQLKNDLIELHDVQIELYGEDGRRDGPDCGRQFEYDQKTAWQWRKGRWRCC